MEEGDEIYETELAQLFSEEDEVSFFMFLCNKNSVTNCHMIFHKYKTLIIDEKRKKKKG